MAPDDDLVDFEEVACQLAGFIIEKLSAGDFVGYEKACLDLMKWKRRIISAIVSGELRPASSATYVNKRLGWTRQLLDHEIEDYDPDHHEIWAIFERRKVYDWLFQTGMPGDEIPETLRPIKKEEASSSQGDVDDLGALEVFGLMVEVFSNQAPEYRRGDNPNRIAIAKEMLNHQPEDTTRMGSRILQQRLSDAHGKWKFRKAGVVSQSGAQYELEAFGLLVEAISQREPRFQQAGYPNCSEIAKAMQDHARSDVSSVDKSNLEQWLLEALEAWEAKKRR